MFQQFSAALSDTFKAWMDKFNGILSALEGLPLPIEHGSNSQMSYLKLANGTVLIWGRLDMGTRYPCNNEWPSGNYASLDFTVNFPVALVKTNPVIVPHVAANDLHPDIGVSTREVGYVSAKMCFWCRSSETDTAKALSLLVVGEWK